MNLAKLRDQPHLSFSSIQEYLDCSLMFKFRRIDKLAPEFIGCPGFWNGGTCCSG